MQSSMDYNPTLDNLNINNGAPINQRTGGRHLDNLICIF